MAVLTGFGKSGEKSLSGCRSRLSLSISTVVTSFMHNMLDLSAYNFSMHAVCLLSCKIFMATLKVLQKTMKPLLPRLCWALALTFPCMLSAGCLFCNSMKCPSLSNLFYAGFCKHFSMHAVSWLPPFMTVLTGFRKLSAGCLSCKTFLKCFELCSFLLCLLSCKHCFMHTLCWLPLMQDFHGTLVKCFRMVFKRQ